MFHDFLNGVKAIMYSTKLHSKWLISALAICSDVTLHGLQTKQADKNCSACLGRDITEKLMKLKNAVEIHS